MSYYTGGRRAALNRNRLRQIAAQAHEVYKQTASAGVEVTAGEARLEVRYCVTWIDETASKTFSVAFGEAAGRSEASARSEVTWAAHNWADRQRADGVDLSAWDKSGRTY
jgi:hypothetical protein